MLAIGHKLNNRYRIEQSLGQGGMAEVYKALDELRFSYVAIKVMRPEMAEDLEFVRRFQREAQVLEKLAHDNIVRFFGFEQDGHLAFIVMGYVEGSNLRSRIFDAMGKPLPLHEVLNISRQVCVALYYAHNMGVFHRDIKPANIMLRPTGEVLLSDFGIAKVASSATLTSGKWGTEPYMSPEQCRGQAVDGRSDLYSYGIVLYEMLCGRRPFNGESAELPSEDWNLRVRWEQMNCKPVPPRQLNPALSAELERVILRCLEKDPGKRYANALELLAALNAAIQPGVAVAEPTQALPPPLPKETQVVESVKPVPETKVPPEPVPGSRAGKFIEPELVRVPAGEFFMGSDPLEDHLAEADELSQHRLYLPDFRIGKYPVTNEEYRLFLLANPQQDKPRGWNGTDYPQGKRRHPVVYVNWYDAIAYCRWLAEMTGENYRLPSEAEWEKAARGMDGRIYPWGNQWDAECCNTDEEGPHGTTPVGQYSRRGDSPYGCADMAGNVWEWTHSLYKPYPYDGKDGREDEYLTALRVLRGGSFYSNARYARCAFRYWSKPGFRNDFAGFRVVVSPFFFPDSRR